MRADQHARVQRLLALALTAYGLVLAWRPLDEADGFFHLSLGRAVLRAGARIVPEPTAFVDFSAPAVASEWLWSVLSYAAYRSGGFGLLSGLGCVLAALACYSAWSLSQRTADAAVSPGLRCAVGVLAVCSVICRCAVRPELWLLCALPWYVVAARAYARSAGSRRLRLGFGLVVACVLWAQLHASFVLCPVIFATQALGPARRLQLRADGLLLALLLAAQLTSPYGANISELIGSHAAGDAPRYIAEMAQPTWAMLNPFSAPNVFAYAALLGLAGSGMLIERRLYPRELSLLVLGAALLATANRFIAEAALLAVPCANQAARALSGHFAPLLRTRARVVIARALTGAGAAALLGLTAEQVQALHGPLGRLGVAEHAFALHAAQALAALPDGSAVLTDYSSSAVVGFVSDGRLRTFVDGRTPLYFDATDFAVARDMARDGAALRAGLRRYHARAAVVRRESAACVQLAERWSVALVEPLFTTFVRRADGAQPSALLPCGGSYFARDACGTAPLRAAITRLDSSGAREFARFLQAESQVRCGADVARALLELRALAPDARPFRPYFERVFVLALLRAQQFDEATAHMLRAIDQGDRGIVSLLQEPAAGELPLSAARRVLTAYLDQAGDEADVGVRGALAEICARAGDEQCARFQAIRAAVRGRYTSALQWLASHHSSPRVRADARRWMEVLTHRDAAARPLASP